MGRLTNQLIGTARGRIGNIVTKAKKTGESIVYPYNPNRKKTESDKARNHNNRFRIVNKFAASVNDSLFLKRIWNYQKGLKGRSAYTRIHSYNYQYSRADSMTQRAKIVPGGIFCDLTKFTSNDDEIAVTIIPSNKLIQVFNLPCVAICMINLNTPETKRKGRLVIKDDIYMLLEQQYDSLKLVEGEPCEIKFTKLVNEFKIIDDYRRVRVFFTLVFETPEKDLLNTSSIPLLFKGEELDREYEELILRENKERETQENMKGKTYFSFTRR